MHKNRNQTQKPAVPAFNAPSAMQQLIKISRQLVDLSERETQALVQKDMVSFFIMQDEKEQLAAQYKNASEQFRERIEEFRTIDRRLLAQLETLQNTLAEKTRANNLIVESIKARALMNTQKTLLTVQELAQMKQVDIEGRATAQKGA